jgi:hypothetical protein
VEQDGSRIVHADAARIPGDPVRACQQWRVRCLRNRDREGNLPAAPRAGGQRFQRIARCGGREDLPHQRRR